MHLCVLYICLCSLASVGLLGVVSYMESQWGVAQFSLPNESPCICAFVGDRKSVVGRYVCMYVCVCVCVCDVIILGGLS